MKYLKFLAPILLVCLSVQSQNLSIELDLSNANKTIGILKNGNSTRSSFKELTLLESSKALLKKLNTTDSTMIEALKKSFDSNAILTKKEGYFQYNTIKENLDQTAIFVAKMQSSIKEVEKRLQNGLSQYIPPDKTSSIKIVGIVGGHSTGYTFGDGEVFYVSLHHMKNDLDYFFQICKHELFHNLQALWFDHNKILNVLEKTRKSSPNYYTYYLLHSLYVEGTATYQDDIKNFKSSEANKAWVERYNKNEKREQHIFWLFDKLVVELQDDYSQEAINKSYGTFFLTTFDESGYYLGDKITQYLLKKQPDKSLKDYMKINSIEFISDYIKLSKKDDNAPYHFSENFEKIVENLLQNTSRIKMQNN